MKRLVLGALMLSGFLATDLIAQKLTASALASPPAKASKSAKKNPDKDPIKDAVGGSGLPPGEMITTEIYADQAFFDSAKHIGIFTGHVIVNDPRFNVQSDKLTIYLNKNQGLPMSTEKPAEKPAPGASPQPDQALEKAVAEGNVGMVREHPGENGGPPVRSIGRADMAVYTTSDGNVELSGTPRVLSGLNMHVATSPDTVMVISQNGQLTTRGPSRTEIKQEPKPSPSPSASPSAAPGIRRAAPAAPSVAPAATPTPTPKR